MKRGGINEEESERKRDPLYLQNLTVTVVNSNGVLTPASMGLASVSVSGGWFELLIFHPV